MLTLMEASSLLNLPVSHIEDVLAEDQETYTEEYAVLFEGEECDYN